MNKIIIFLATGFYAGKCPIAPGTAGTLVGVLLYLMLRHLSFSLYAITVLTFIILAIWVSGKAQDILSVEDPPQVVIDEIAGFLVTMAFHPSGYLFIVTGFILFRIFDIVKPFPIKWVDKKLLNGWGIVLDDVLAGVYANILLWLFGVVLAIISV